MKTYNSRIIKRKFTLKKITYIYIYLYSNDIMIFCLFNKKSICENVFLMKVNMNCSTKLVVNLKLSLIILLKRINDIWKIILFDEKKTYTIGISIILILDLILISYFYVSHLIRYIKSLVLSVE